MFRASLVADANSQNTNFRGGAAVSPARTCGLRTYSDCCVGDRRQHRLQRDGPRGRRPLRVRPAAGSRRQTGPRPGRRRRAQLFARTIALGNEHERRELDRLRDEFGDGVAIIGRPAYTPAGLRAAAQATARAVANRAPVVYQPAMFDGRFIGFADFLVLDGDRYRVVDTKLARSPKVTALLQLAAYADALAAADVPIAAEAELHLGDGAVVSYRVCDLVPVYRTQRERLQLLLDEHCAADAAVRWDDDRVHACFRCPVHRAAARDRRPAARRGHARDPAREASGRRRHYGGRPRRVHRAGARPGVQRAGQADRAGQAASAAT